MILESSCRNRAGQVWISERVLASSSHTKVRQVWARKMGECHRCGNIHAAGFCPIYGGTEPTVPTPTYAVAMRMLSAETRRTRGDGNMCLFHALAGEEGGCGARWPGGGAVDEGWGAHGERIRETA